MHRSENVGNNFKDLFESCLKKVYNVFRFCGFLLLQSITLIIQFILFIDEIFT